MIGRAFNISVFFIFNFQQLSRLHDLPGGFANHCHIVFECDHVNNTGHAFAAAASTDFIFVPNAGGR